MLGKRADGRVLNSIEFAAHTGGIRHWRHRSWGCYGGGSNSHDPPLPQTSWSQLCILSPN